MKEILPQKQLENLETVKVNPKLWSKISHKTKPIDTKKQ